MMLMNSLVAGVTSLKECVIIPIWRVILGLISFMIKL